MRYQDQEVFIIEDLVGENGDLVKLELPSLLDSVAPIFVTKGRCFEGEKLLKRGFNFEEFFHLGEENPEDVSEVNVNQSEPEQKIIKNNFLLDFFTC